MKMHATIPTYSTEAFPVWYQFSETSSWFSVCFCGSGCQKEPGSVMQFTSGSRWWHSGQIGSGIINNSPSKPPICPSSSNFNVSAVIVSARYHGPISTGFWLDVEWLFGYRFHVRLFFVPHISFHLEACAGWLAEIFELEELLKENISSVLTLGNVSALRNNSCGRRDGRD